jgi:hypothetical protein
MLHGAVFSKRAPLAAGGKEMREKNAAPLPLRGDPRLSGSPPQSPTVLFGF